VVGPLPLQVKGDPINHGWEEVVEPSLLGKTALVLLLAVAVDKKVAAHYRREAVVPKAVVGSIVGNTAAVGSCVLKLFSAMGILSTGFVGALCGLVGLVQLLVFWELLLAKPTEGLKDWAISSWSSIMCVSLAKKALELASVLRFRTVGGWLAIICNRGSFRSSSFKI
jgi:hypothetical protein